MQVKQKSLANQLHVSLLDRSVLTYRSIAQMSEKQGQEEKPQKVYKELGYHASNCFEFEKVLDWNKRISGFSEKQKNYYKVAFERYAEFKALLVNKDKDWEITINDKKERLVTE